ncbi:hypothetical protein GCM10027567_13450 [Spongiibacter taiwanensis]
MPTRLAIISAFMAVIVTALLSYHICDGRREDQLLLDRAKRNLDSDPAYHTTEALIDA